MAMNEAGTRAKICELMAAGALLSEFAPIQRPVSPAPTGPKPHIVADSLLDQPCTHLRRARLLGAVPLLRRNPCASSRELRGALETGAGRIAAGALASDASSCTRQPAVHEGRCSQPELSQQ